MEDRTDFQFNFTKAFLPGATFKILPTTLHTPPCHKHPQSFPEACLCRAPKHSGEKKNSPNASQMSECVA